MEEEEETTLSIFAEEDELQVGFAFVETGKDGRDGGRPFFSIIEGRGETWLVAERTYIESLPPHAHRTEGGEDLDTVDCSISHRLFAPLARGG